MTMTVQNNNGNPFVENTMTDAKLPLKFFQTDKPGDKVPPPKDKTQGSKGELPDVPVQIGDDELPSLDLMPASLGASALAAIQKLANEERQTASTIEFNNSLAIADKMKTQADNIEHNAKVQLALNLTAAVIQISASCASVGMSSKAIAGGGSDGALMIKNTQIQGVSGGLNGIASMFTAGATFHDSMTQADNKRIDAEIERMRANNAQLDSLQTAMKELIKSARQNQDSIQQSTNQTRTKILC